MRLPSPSRAWMVDLWMRPLTGAMMCSDQGMSISHDVNTDGALTRMPLAPLDWPSGPVEIAGQTRAVGVLTVAVSAGKDFAEAVFTLRRSVVPVPLTEPGEGLLIGQLHVTAQPAG